MVNARAARRGRFRFVSGLLRERGGDGVDQSLVDLGLDDARRIGAHRVITFLRQDFGGMFLAQPDEGKVHGWCDDQIGCTRQPRRQIVGGWSVPA
jgi:hypothetical protein